MDYISPFPGMDPWLENQWGDFHQRLVMYACDAIQPQLPRDLRARTQERSYLEAVPGDPRGIYPNLRLVEYPSGKKRTREAGGAAVAEPIVVQIPLDPITEGYIEILESPSGNRVVTIVEVLSPGNKNGGEGQKLYLKKQSETLGSKTSLVEIDLLRGGKHVIALAPSLIPSNHRTPYRVCVRRSWKPEAGEIYPIPLREPLPTIGVPLREHEKDVTLDLQELVTRAYINGRYDQTDYKRRPDPPLERADATWAEEILREKGLLQSA
jgi:hypothetical protein